MAVGDDLGRGGGFVADRGDSGQDVEQGRSEADRRRTIAKNDPGLRSGSRLPKRKGKPFTTASSLAGSTHQPASVAKTSAWDDAVDTQIAQVGRQMALVEQDWRAQADSLDLIQYRLKSVEEEVGEGKF